MRKASRALLLIALLSVILLPSSNAFAATEPFYVNTSDNKSLRQNVRLSTSSQEPFIKQDSASVLVGKSDILSVYKVPSDSDITYKSSDESILTVKALEDNSCEYTGKSVGTAVITVKVKERVFFFMESTTTLKFTVDVTPLAVSVKLSKTRLKMPLDANRKLQYTIRPSISDEIPDFKSSNTNIVTVSPKGLIKSVGVGTATITATIENGSTDTCKITVIDK